MTLTISQREGSYWLFFSTLICLGFVLLALLAWMLIPSDRDGSNLTFLHSENYPSTDAPYLVQNNTLGSFWLVNTGSGFLALDRHVYGENGTRFCIYSWTPANGRFEDPCHGTKFTLDGTYIEGPPRLLYAYPVTVEDDGTIIVNMNITTQNAIFSTRAQAD